MCLTVLDSARLAYPSNKANKDETILVARNRFLLEEFPPRDREKPDGGTQGGNTPPTQ